MLIDIPSELLPALNHLVVKEYDKIGIQNKDRTYYIKHKEIVKKKNLDRYWRNVELGIIIRKIKSPVE